LKKRIKHNIASLKIPVIQPNIRPFQSPYAEIELRARNGPMKILDIINPFGKLPHPA
jgi:hypothetical protein